MTNREKYKFDYFTIENYRNQLLYALENGFEFISFTDEFNKKRKEIIWRHDVEFSLDIALEMAKIENELGISTTYFFQVHSEFYNILERYSSDILLEIKTLGHHIGLHFDSHYYNIQSEDQLNQYITQDKEYFEKVFNIKLEVFSFHNTTPFTLNCRNKTYGGLLNVYSDYYRNRYKYCADSTGYWRFEVLDDVLNDKKVTHLQVLVHDAMWSNEVLSPRQRVRKSIQENADRIKDQYDRILIQFGAKNIDD
jgi:peptidoglycan/xylan/chitin deacetylase (PgdA/CDA1 family)